jgi:hypothetical protein
VGTGVGVGAGVGLVVGDGAGVRMAVHAGVAVSSSVDVSDGAPPATFPVGDAAGGSVPPAGLRGPIEKAAAANNPRHAVATTTTRARGFGKPAVERFDPPATSAAAAVGAGLPQL